MALLGGNRGPGVSWEEVLGPAQVAGEISQLPDPGLEAPPERVLSLPSSRLRPAASEATSSWDGWPDLLVLSS